MDNTFHGQTLFLFAVCKYKKEPYSIGYADGNRKELEDMLIGKGWYVCHTNTPTDYVYGNDMNLMLIRFHEDNSITYFHGGQARDREIWDKTFACAGS